MTEAECAWGIKIEIAILHHSTTLSELYLTSIYYYAALAVYENKDRPNLRTIRVGFVIGRLLICVPGLIKMVDPDSTYMCPYIAHDMTVLIIHCTLEQLLVYYNSN